MTPRRLERHRLLGGRVERQHLAVDLRLAHAPGDQLAVLRAEIEHDDGVEGRRRGLNGGIELCCHDGLLRFTGGGTTEEDIFAVELPIGDRLQFDLDARVQGIDPLH